MPPREDWFDSLPSRARSFPIAFLPPTFLPSFVSPWPRAARDDNERRNPAGISVRDKRILTAYEQASALMVPTLPPPLAPRRTLSLPGPRPPLRCCPPSLLTIGISTCKRIPRESARRSSTIDRSAESVRRPRAGSVLGPSRSPPVAPLRAAPRRDPPFPSRRRTRRTSARAMELGGTPGRVGPPRY